MSEHRILLRSLLWNAKRRGRDRSTADGKWRYTKHVVYAHNRAVGRYVKVADGTVLVYLALDGSSCPPRQFAHNDKRPTPSFLYVNVPDIGVFSRFEDDWIDDGELHDRISWLCHKQAQEAVEHARIWPLTKLLNGRSEIAGVVQIAAVLNAARIYHEYRNAMQLVWWGQFSINRYHDAVEEALVARRKEYGSEKAVAQRERQRARKEAKKALGVKDD